MPLFHTRAFLVFVPWSIDVRLILKMEHKHARIYRVVFHWWCKIPMERLFTIDALLFQISTVFHVVSMWMSNCRVVSFTRWFHMCFALLEMITLDFQRRIMPSRLPAAWITEVPGSSINQVSCRFWLHCRKKETAPKLQDSLIAFWIPKLFAKGRWCFKSNPHHALVFFWGETLTGWDILGSSFQHRCTKDVHTKQCGGSSLHTWGVMDDWLTSWS